MAYYSLPSYGAAVAGTALLYSVMQLLRSRPGARRRLHRAHFHDS